MTQSLNENYETATVSTKVANCQNGREKSWKIIRTLNSRLGKLTNCRKLRILGKASISREIIIFMEIRPIKHF